MVTVGGQPATKSFKKKKDTEAEIDGFCWWAVLESNQ